METPRKVVKSSRASARALASNRPSRLASKPKDTVRIYDSNASSPIDSLSASKNPSGMAQRPLTRRSDPKSYRDEHMSMYGPITLPDYPETVPLRSFLQRNMLEPRELLPRRFLYPDLEPYSDLEDDPEVMWHNEMRLFERGITSVPPPPRPTPANPPRPDPVEIVEAAKKATQTKYDYVLTSLQRTVMKPLTSDKFRPYNSQYGKLQRYLYGAAPQDVDKDSDVALLEPAQSKGYRDYELPAAAANMTVRKYHTQRIGIQGRQYSIGTQPRDPHMPRVTCNDRMRIVHIVRGSPTFPPHNADIHFPHEFIVLPKPQTEAMRKHEMYFANRRFDETSPRYRCTIPMAGFRSSQITFRSDGHRVILASFADFNNATGTWSRKVIEIIDLPQRVRFRNLNVQRNQYGCIILEERVSYTDLKYRQVARRTTTQEELFHRSIFPNGKKSNNKPN